MSNELVEWLRTQLDVDERRADEIHREDCGSLPPPPGYNGPFPCDCGVPQGIRREVEAKRRILDRCIQARADQGIYCEDGQEAVAEDVLQLLAPPYADRPGYREEWRP